jgi:hypothetical protein
MKLKEALENENQKFEQTESQDQIEKEISDKENQLEIESKF